MIAQKYDYHVGSHICPHESSKIMHESAGMMFSVELASPPFALMTLPGLY